MTIEHINYAHIFINIKLPREEQTRFNQRRVIQHIQYARVFGMPTTSETFPMFIL